MTIRLTPLVPTAVATAQFLDVRKASEAVIEILNTGIGIHALSVPSLLHNPWTRSECVELVDAAFMRMTTATENAARKYNIADHLFFKLQGATPASLAEAVNMVKYIVKKHGGDKSWPAQNEEAEAMWTDRKNGHYAGLAYAGKGAKALSTDVWCA